MVRRSQSSNPRSVVVLTSGADWPGRAASQRRSSGSDFAMPEQQAAKIQDLHCAILVLRVAVNTKNRLEARYQFSRARALVKALPASATVQERRQLSLLRKKFATGSKALSQNAKKGKPKPKPQRKPAPKPKSRSSGKPEPTRVPDLGDRLLNRTSLGYAPADEPQRPRTG